MCVALLQNTIRACGLSTRVRFVSVSAAGEQLRSLLPFGRAAVFADDASHIAAVRAQIEAFRPMCCVVGNEPLEGLFTLPDEVRAVIALGARSIFAARFFATLRGGFVVAVPLSADAEGLFERTMPPKCAQAGYPLRPPDLALIDESLLASAEDAVGYAALSALCAEDAELHTLFTGGELPSFSQTVQALREYGGEKKGLFCACALFRLTLGGNAFPAPSAAALCEDRYALFSYFAARYVHFLEREQPRGFFVADYTGRVMRAYEECGLPPKQIFKNIAVPAAAECRRRLELFRQARARLQTRGALLQAFVQQAGRLYAAHGGKSAPKGSGGEPSARQEGKASFGRQGEAQPLRFARAAALYECAAELSPLFGVAAAQRDFGLLADLPKYVCSAEHMRAAALQ